MDNMSPLTWLATHRTWLVLGMGIPVLLLAVAAGVWFFVLRSPGTQVSLRQAVRLYRLEEKSGRPGDGAHLPPPGVYRYLTSGGEQLSLGDIGRSFPTTSEMIVTEDGCATMKWEPLVQHMEGLVECPERNGSLVVESALSYEEIAGTKTTSVIHCPATTYFVPPDWFVGERWNSKCHSEGERVGVSGEVVGASWVDVGRNREPAVHTRLTLFFSGSESGTNPNDYWVSLNGGLILRQRETVEMREKAGPLGDVRYAEQMAITLASIVPER
jgi:hypothetical protein